MATYTGSTDDMKKGWFKGKSIAGGALDELFRKHLNGLNSKSAPGAREALDTYLAGLGYTGTPRDRYRRALINSLGGSANSAMTIRDLERAFYSNSANDFVTGP